MENNTSKSFWERPEGTTGMIFGVLIGGGFLYGLYLLLPILIPLLQNTLYAGVLAAGIAALAYILFVDKRFKTLSFYYYKSVMRAITQLFVNIDPIGILKSYVESLKDQLKDMEEQLGNLKGQITQVKIEIQNTTKDISKNLSYAAKANEKGDSNLAGLYARKAGRGKESLQTYKNLCMRMTTLYNVIMEYRNQSKIMIEDLIDTVNVKSREQNMIKASYKAYKSAKQIINGDTDKREVFEMSMENLANDYGQKLGEITNFIDQSREFMATVDIENGAFQEDGLKMLEEITHGSKVIDISSTVEGELLPAFDSEIEY